MPTKEEFTFLSKNGKTQIHAVRWLPDTTEYRAVLQITHGILTGMTPLPRIWHLLASLWWDMTIWDTERRWRQKKTGDILPISRVIRSLRI